MTEERLAREASPEHRKTREFRAVALAFDGIASAFDSNLENEITKQLRERLYSIINGLIQPDATVLDVNCGTGIDAVELTRLGYRVYGTDISPNMIDAARRKFQDSDHIKNRFTVCSYDALSPSVVPMADLVLSNFGGLNCTSDLASAARAIGTVTKRGGYFVGVIMPPFSLWESASYVVRRQWPNVFRRIHDHVAATGFSEISFPVFYYSPKRVKAEFAPSYSHKDTVGLSIFSPTPQSINFVRRHPSVWKILAGCDAVVGRFPVLRVIGDHYIIVLQKK